MRDVTFFTILQHKDNFTFLHFFNFLNFLNFLTFKLCSTTEKMHALVLKIFVANVFISLFQHNTKQFALHKSMYIHMYRTQQHCYAYFPLKPYTLTGFEPESSVTEEDKMSTAPRRQGTHVKRCTI
jgi:hypothetical protein